MRTKYITCVAMLNTYARAYECVIGWKLWMKMDTLASSTGGGTQDNGQDS